VPKPAQAYEPEVPVKVREWISPALASPDLVLDASSSASNFSAPAMAQESESHTRTVTGGGGGPSFTTSKCE
jgi:hypothetical protein